MKPVEEIGPHRTPERPEQKCRRQELLEFWQCGAKYAELTNFNPKTYLQTEIEHYKSARTHLRIPYGEVIFHQRKGKIYAERVEKKRIAHTSMTHEVKISPEEFQILSEIEKTFFILKDDRDYKVGDYIAFNEWDEKSYSGRREVHRILYIQRSDHEPGLTRGYCIVGFKNPHYQF